LNLSFYIARRYFVSKKSHNIINIISGISVVGVAVGTMALIIVLSVFNGFEQLVVSLFNSFNPDIAITASRGKTFNIAEVPVDKLRRIPGVLYLTEVIEENALIRYKEKPYIVTIKGVSEEFIHTSRVDTMMVEGTYLLQDGDQDFAVMGNGVAYYLSANLNDYINPLVVFVPRRDAAFSGGFENAFNSEVIFPSGFFSIQQDYDIKYVLVPLRFTQRLLAYENERTGLEIGLDKTANLETVQRSMETLLGDGFVVKNRYQQQEILYKIMKSEKWAIFLILTFILLIATFNVVGSLSMLILDKKKDIAVLRSLGASQQLIRRIFITEGMLISLIGALTGLFLGGLICWLQITFGLIKLGDSGSTFVVDTYPVQMQIIDFAGVFVTVMAIGYLAAWYPVHNIRRINTGAVREE
jgi:lipoprotein-releasing system permease protein